MSEGEAEADLDGEEKEKSLPLGQGIRQDADSEMGGESLGGIRRIPSCTLS